MKDDQDVADLPEPQALVIELRAVATRLNELAEALTMALDHRGGCD